MRYTIPKGTGFTVGADFYRAPHDMELTRVEASPQARHVFGYVAPIADAPVSFMRPNACGKWGVFVHVLAGLVRVADGGAE